MSEVPLNISSNFNTKETLNEINKSINSKTSKDQIVSDLVNKLTFSQIKSLESTISNDLHKAPTIKLLNRGKLTKSELNNIQETIKGVKAAMIDLKLNSLRATYSQDSQDSLPNDLLKNDTFIRFYKEKNLTDDKIAKFDNQAKTLLYNRFFSYVKEKLSSGSISAEEEKGLESFLSAAANAKTLDAKPILDDHNVFLGFQSQVSNLQQSINSESIMYLSATLNTTMLGNFQDPNEVSLFIHEATKHFEDAKFKEKVIKGMMDYYVNNNDFYKENKDNIDINKIKYGALSK